jgi:hypothetical protein
VIKVPVIVVGYVQFFYIKFSFAPFSGSK